MNRYDDLCDLLTSNLSKDIRTKFYLELEKEVKDNIACGAYIGTDVEGVIQDLVQFHKDISPDCGCCYE